MCWGERDNIRNLDKSPENIVKNTQIKSGQTLGLLTQNIYLEPYKLGFQRCHIDIQTFLKDGSKIPG